VSGIKNDPLCRPGRGACLRLSIISGTRRGHPLLAIAVKGVGATLQNRAPHTLEVLYASEARRARIELDAVLEHEEHNAVAVPDCL